MFINQILTKLKSLVYSKSETDSLLNGKASSSHTHTKSEISDFPAYGSTAGTICQGNDSRLSDARTPTSHTHTKSQITDFPTIPTVNNATLKIQKNGTDVKTFTANASSDVTCNITVPTKVSELSNDSGFLTSHQSLSNYSTLANTVKSLSISGKTITVTPGSGNAYTLTTQDTTYSHPTSSGNKHIPSGGSSGQFLGWSADGTAKWVNNPNTNTWTAMVGATSSANGSVGYVNAVPPKDGYNTKYLRADGTWQVPPDHTYTVNNATLTIQKNGSNVATFTSNASSNVTCNITVPTKTSELTNNSGFLTSHQSLSNYSTLANTIKSLSISGKTITYTKGDNSTGTLTTQDTNTTYSNFVKSGSGAKAGLVPAPSTTAGTTKYLREDGTWQVPPDHTYTVNNATLTIQKNGSNVATFTANASSNVTANISVPTKVSQLTNDSGFITSSGSCNYANSAGSAGSATTADAVSTSVAAGSSKDLVYAAMVNSDQCRIRCGGSDDAGYLEIATADNGNEPIYVRQFKGVFSSVARTLTLLDENGNTQIPGTVTAPTFSGNLNGNCSGSAGSVAWSKVSGRPTALSQFTNDSGFISSAIKESSINTSGWCLLHGGLLIQYGTETGTVNGFTINFHKAFSMLPIVVANYGDNVSFDTPCTVDDVSKTAFIARHSNSGTWRVNWIAIGKGA